MNWTRREFVRGAAGVIALPQWLPQASRGGFAYVASGTHAIHAFEIRGGAWKPLQQIASVAPSAIAVSGASLFAANDVNLYDRLPRGSVERYSIGADGHLTLIERIALSLSATHPRSLAVSPDGKLLAVASYSDGIYNLFSIAGDGRLTRCGIFKEIGCTHPLRLCFNDNGTRLFSWNAERARLSVFGVEGGRLTRVEQSDLAPEAEDAFRIAGDSIFYGTVKVADVTAAKSAAIRT